MDERQPDPSPLSGPEFRAMLTPLGDAMSEGRFDNARSIMLEAFQFVADRAIEDTGSDDAKESDAERRGDWSAFEQLYLQRLASEKHIPTVARNHWRLGKLYRFLGRKEEAAAHGRKGFELICGHEVEMLSVMAAVEFSRLSDRCDVVEVERALRFSLSRLPVGPIYASFRAQALAEIANARLVQGDSAAAVSLAEEALSVIEPLHPLTELPGYQATFARAWHVRALAQAEIGDREAASAAWKNAISARARMRSMSAIESPLEADADSRFVFSAAEGLARAGEVRLANETLRECNRIRSDWRLPPLEVAFGD